MWALQIKATCFSNIRHPHHPPTRPLGREEELGGPAQRSEKGERKDLCSYHPVHTARLEGWPQTMALHTGGRKNSFASIRQLPHHQAPPGRPEAQTPQGRLFSRGALEKELMCLSRHLDDVTCIFKNCTNGMRLVGRAEAHWHFGEKLRQAGKRQAFLTLCLWPSWRRPPPPQPLSIIIIML